MVKTHTHLIAVALPLLLIGTMQLTGCVRRQATPPIPGGVYRSTSGGAQFDQSVSLVNQAGELTGNISDTRLRNIHRVQQEPNKMFVTAGTQGIFRSDDDGQSWQEVNQPLSAVTGLVQLNNGVLLASGSDSDGQGIVIRSLNTGDSWERVLTIPALHRKKRALFEIIKPPQPPPVFVSSIVQDPFNADQVYATTSTGEVIVGEQSGKLWRNFFRVKKDRRDPITNQAIASIRSIAPSPHRNGELFLITTDGELVRLFEDETQAIVLPDAIANAVDITFIQQFPASLFVGTDRGALISRDNGENWAELDLPISTVTPVRNVVVRVSPTNPARMLVAVDSIIYRSEDGGATFNTLSLGLPNHVVTDISIDPTNAARVLLVTTPAQS